MRDANALQTTWNRSGATARAGDAEGGKRLCGIPKIGEPSSGPYATGIHLALCLACALVTQRKLEMVPCPGGLFPVSILLLPLSNALATNGSWRLRHFWWYLINRLGVALIGRMTRRVPQE